MLIYSDPIRFIHESTHKIELNFKHVKSDVNETFQ